MDKTKFFEEAKKLARRTLQEDLQTVEMCESIDDLVVILFGTSYSTLTGFHICKDHVIDKTRVSEECNRIRDKYLNSIKSSD